MKIFVFLAMLIPVIAICQTNNDIWKPVIFQNDEGGPGDPSILPPDSTLTVLEASNIQLLLESRRRGISTFDCFASKELVGQWLPPNGNAPDWYEVELKTSRSSLGTYNFIISFVVELQTDLWVPAWVENVQIRVRGCFASGKYTKWSEWSEPFNQ